ncbi:MAG: hypothetical protein EOO77_09025 [Oxalobacteraceae bacterium]|nr:MAG: hypothetical protein EOO77_09025 [Oxalobacteraceae bacterium]
MKCANKHPNAKLTTAKSSALNSLQREHAEKKQKLAAETYDDVGTYIRESKGVEREYHELKNL